MDLLGLSEFSLHSQAFAYIWLHNMESLHNAYCGLCRSNQNKAASLRAQSDRHRSWGWKKCVLTRSKTQNTNDRKRSGGWKVMCFDVAQCSLRMGSPGCSDDLPTFQRKNHYLSMNWILKKIGCRPKSFFLSICRGWGGFWWMAPIPFPPFHVFLPGLKTRKSYIKWALSIFSISQLFVLLSLALVHCNYSHVPVLLFTVELWLRKFVRYTWRHFSSN